MTPSPEPQKDDVICISRVNYCRAKDFCGGLPGVLPPLIFGGKNQPQKTRESAIPFELFDFQNIILRYFIFNFVPVICVGACAHEHRCLWRSEVLGPVEL